MEELTRLTIDVQPADAAWFRDMARTSGIRQWLAFTELRRLWEAKNTKRPRKKVKR